MPDKSYEEKLPCILIAPAGSRLFHGMPLADGDRPEHIPYVRAGFAVAAYEVDGHISDEAGEGEVKAAARAFKDSNAGIANAVAALDYLLAKVPTIDPNRIYTAGHSSAATLSILVAAHDPRIKGCIAYAPACDVVERVGDHIIELWFSDIPGYRQFLESSSPNRVANRLNSPVFLFHADDDSIIPRSEIDSFAETLKKANKDITYVRARRGDHYDSMIEEGIPKAIEWLKKLSERN